ncbi:hypothetical protein BJV74DRAFT_902126 [Russula compacta]|nr:hypothetical protein BJV74DRAFT_902126 [Russula compacta]
MSQGRESDKANARLKNIHVGPVDIFAAPPDIRTTRARVVTGDADRDAHSPADVLAGFDVDAPCCAWDGNRVWAKYSSCGIEVYIPGLKRSEIDPTVRPVHLFNLRSMGVPLATSKASPASLPIEKLTTPELRNQYQQRRSVLRGDLKADAEFSGLESSDYDIVNLYILYGPRWDPRRIEKLIYKISVRKTAVYVAASRLLKKTLVDSISGRFNPTDEGEWSGSAYIQATAKFFGVINNNDTVAVTQMIKDGEDLNRRDHVGRTPLHIAILSNSVEAANLFSDLLLGAPLSISLHRWVKLAWSRGCSRTANNEKSAEEKRKTEAAARAEDPEDAERVWMSGEDDWSSEESGNGKPPTKVRAEKADDSFEDAEEAADILDVSIPDWDFGFTAVVDVLLAAGTDPNSAACTKGVTSLHPFTLTTFTQSEDCATRILEGLVAAQAVSSTADENLLATFHRMVIQGKTKIVPSPLTCDPNAKQGDCGFLVRERLLSVERDARGDADGFIPQQITAQNVNTTLTEILLQYGPTEQLYTENSVGETPTAPFDVEKQKIEIPKLRATLDALVTDGRLVRGTKLANELFMFAGQTARKNPEEKEDWVDPAVSKGSTARPLSDYEMQLLRAPYIYTLRIWQTYNDLYSGTLR